MARTTRERARLRDIRESVGKTFEEVGQHIGRDRHEVSRIETRELDFKLSTLHRYAHALGARCELAFVFPNGRRVVVIEAEARAPSPPPPPPQSR